MKKVLSIVIALAMIVGTVSALGIFAHAEETTNVVASDFAASDYNNSTIADTEDGLAMQGKAVKWNLKEKLPVATEGFSWEFDFGDHPEGSWIIMGLTDGYVIPGWTGMKACGIVVILWPEATAGDGWNARTALIHDSAADYPTKHSNSATFIDGLADMTSYKIEVRVDGTTYGVYLNGILIGNHDASAQKYPWLLSKWEANGGATFSFCAYEHIANKADSGTDLNFLTTSLNGKACGLMKVTADDFAASDYNNSTIADVEDGIAMQGKSVKWNLKEKLPVATEGFSWEFDFGDHPEGSWIIMGLTDGYIVPGWTGMKACGIVVVLWPEATAGDGWNARTALIHDSAADYPTKHSNSATFIDGLADMTSYKIEVRVDGTTYGVYLNDVLIGNHDASAQKYPWLLTKWAANGGATFSFCAYEHIANKADSGTNLNFLTKSLNGMECGGVNVQYDALRTSIAAAETIDREIYTTASLATLDTALADAKAALDSDDQAVVDAAASALDAAVAGLVKLPSTANLEASIAAAEALVEADYTTGTWSAMQEALAAAKAALTSEDAVVIADAISALDAAVDGLVKMPITTALEAEIAAAEALTEADYTEETWSAMQEALVAAKAALTSEDQAEVDAAAAALKAAVESLMEPADNQSDKYGPSAEGDDAGDSIVDNDDGSTTMIGTDIRLTYSEKLPVLKEGFKAEIKLNSVPDTGWVVLGLTESKPVRGWQTVNDKGVVMVLRMDATDGWTTHTGLTYSDGEYPIHGPQKNKNIDFGEGDTVTVELKPVGTTFEYYVNGVLVTTYSADPNSDKTYNYGWLAGALEDAVFSVAAYDPKGSGETINLDVTVIEAYNSGENNNDDNKAPDTGDNNAVSAIALTAVVCAIVVGGVVIFRRKRSTQH